MPMQNLKSRTKQFALRIVHLCNAVEKSGGSANGYINISH